MLFRFFRSEPASAIVLLAAAITALAVANSPLTDAYHDVLSSSLLGLSLHHWINDALMAVFFLLVGLEIKQEVLNGELRTWSSRMVPGIAAIGGMIAPAVIFVAINLRQPEHLRGWAIPSATDIAFALGVLTLLGSTVPSSLRALLVGIAIIDDLGAILVIALFYTEQVSLGWFALAGCSVLVLITLNRRGVQHLAPYLIVGAGLWICIYQSGLHATLAGVILAFAIPASSPSGLLHTPLQTLEHAIDPWVSFVIVPLFGFANAGVTFAGVSSSAFVGTVPLGIALGLIVGKQAGVFGAIWFMIRCNPGTRPAGTSWWQLYGLSLLCGIGFTMSLFIGGLAYSSTEHLMDATRIGVIGGSVCSAILGIIVLKRSSPVST
jgi:NhaA family Na+:H+ antiporter